MLEDEAGDIIRKARRGQDLSRAQVARASGLAESELRALESLERPMSADQALSLARVLGLDGPKLAAIATHAYQPLPRAEVNGESQVRRLVVHQPDGWESNCYLFAFHDTEEAVVIDPGAEPERIMAELDRLGWLPRYVALTHGHRDHVGGLRSILDEWAVSVLLGSGDLEMTGLPASRVHLVSEGEALPLGRHSIRAILTPGHTPGGVTYLVDGSGFVGDALFAGSVGNANVTDGGYRMLLESLQDKVLTLPEHILLYPGHGPVTSVGEERQANPFFPPCLAPHDA